ncbi:MAG: type IV pilin [Natronomonas sp.]
MGVALLIAITVILAAVIGGVVLGLGTGGVDTPQAQINADFDADEYSVTIHHNGGEPLPEDQVFVVLENAAGDEATVALDDGDGIDDEPLTAGDSVTYENNKIDGLGTDDSEIESVQLIWEDPNSDSETVLEDFEA